MWWSSQQIYDFWKFSENKNAEKLLLVALGVINVNMLTMENPLHTIQNNGKGIFNSFDIAIKRENPGSKEYR